jgi:hypothetical protein
MAWSASEWTTVPPNRVTNIYVQASRPGDVWELHRSDGA